MNVANIGPNPVQTITVYRIEVDGATAGIAMVGSELGAMSYVEWPLGLTQSPMDRQVLNAVGEAMLRSGQYPKRTP